MVISDKNNISLIYEASIQQQRILMKEIQRRRANGEPPMTPEEQDKFINHGAETIIDSDQLWLVWSLIPFDGDQTGPQYEPNVSHGVMHVNLSDHQKALWRDDLFIKLFDGVFVPHIINDLQPKYAGHKLLQITNLTGNHGRDIKLIPRSYEAPILGEYPAKGRIISVSGVVGIKNPEMRSVDSLPVEKLFRGYMAFAERDIHITAVLNKLINSHNASHGFSKYSPLYRS